VPSEDPPENDDGRGHPNSLSLRRALVFVLLGPVFGALVAFSLVAVVAGEHFDSYGIPVTYMFSLLICAITGPIDGVMARVVPIYWRALMTAVVGAAVAVGFIVLPISMFGGFKSSPLLLLIRVAVIGALSTGACSLLSHNYRS
jgi:hypothetical protein